MRNGELLDAAERAGFGVFVTTDRNLRYQQNLAGRKIAIVVLSKGRWKLIRARQSEIAAAIDSAQPGSFTEVEIPGTYAGASLSDFKIGTMVSATGVAMPCFLPRRATTPLRASHSSGLPSRRS